eukprot:746562-Hanusia_phi.AAC.3
MADVPAVPHPVKEQSSRQAEAWATSLFGAPWIVLTRFCSPRKLLMSFFSTSRSQSSSAMNVPGFASLLVVKID